MNMSAYINLVKNCSENELRDFLSKNQPKSANISLEAVMFNVAITIIRYDKINMMKVLLHDYNFDITCRNNYIMNYCGEYGSVDMLTLLLEYNNISMTDSNEILQSVMKSAYDKNNYPIVKMLLEYGFDLNTLNYDWFILTITNNNLDIVKLLIEYGVNVTYQDNLALFTAIKYNHYDIIVLLLQNGANVNDINRRFSNQQDNNKIKIIKLLNENNIDIVAYLSILLSGKKLKS